MGGCAEITTLTFLEFTKAESPTGQESCGGHPRSDQGLFSPNFWQEAFFPNSSYVSNVPLAAFVCRIPSNFGILKIRAPMHYQFNKLTDDSSTLQIRESMNLALRCWITQRGAY